MTALQLRLNPVSWRLMLDDKAIFYRYCAVAGIPVPLLLGVFFRRTAGWSRTGGSPWGREAWLDFFRKECPEDFVVKPALGRSGRGVRLLKRAGEGFEENGSRTIGAATLYDELMTKGIYHAFVVQERVRNHPSITQLSGSEGLQTARVFTAVHDDNRARVIYAYLKLIVGGNVIDNYVSGTTGNFVARVNIENGVLFPGVADGAGMGFQPAPVHPTTGLPIAGFQLPHWEQVREMLCTAAEQFRPIRSIGWDVAMTAGGPVIIEGNFTPDPPTSGSCMDEFLDTLPLQYPDHRIHPRDKLRSRGQQAHNQIP